MFYIPWGPSCFSTCTDCPHGFFFHLKKNWNQVTFICVPSVQNIWCCKWTFPERLNEWMQNSKRWMSGLWILAVMDSNPCLPLIVWFHLSLNFLIWSILIFHRIHICEFTYSLKFMCNSKAIFMAQLWLFMDMGRAAKNLSHPTCMFSAEGEHFSFQLLYCKQVFFLWSI